MSTHMVRKQIYILRRQDALLKRLSKARGESEAEIIRQALERELVSTPSQPVRADRSAWEELISFLERRHRTASGRQPYQWNREEIYTQRESRWHRDQEQD